MIKWAVFGQNITQVEIVRETANFVFIAEKGGERREMKMSRYGGYFDTFRAAKLHVIERISKRLADLRQMIDVLTEQLAKANALTLDDCGV